MFKYTVVGGKKVSASGSMGLRCGGGDKCGDREGRTRETW